MKIYNRKYIVYIKNKMEKNILDILLNYIIKILNIYLWK